MKKIDKRKFLSELKSYLIITLALIVYTFSISTFIVPNNLVGGGVAGISAIVFYATQGHVSMGLTYIVVNAVLILLALKIIGFSFGGKTIYAVALISVLLDVMPHIIPQTFIQELSLSNGKLLCAIFGSAITGSCIGISISQGGSTGGTDIIAMLVNKYKNISPGKVILISDAIIILSTLVIPSYDSAGVAIPLSGRVATAAYGIILVSVSSYAIDLCLSGTKQSVQLFVFSNHSAEIADLLVGMGRGVSVIPATGWYTKTEKDILMVVAHKTELNMILRSVKSIDKDAFLSVSTVMGVYGNGFDQIKSQKSK